MNRTYHLKETLIKNIEDNLEYEDLEHVVLNYNSKDDLEEWIVENLLHYVASGRLKYYKTLEPSSFNMTHSKNMVCKLAMGDIVCLIDADNFSGQGYAKYVNEHFQRMPVSFLTTIGIRKVKNPIDVLGRVCFMKKDFIRVGGFDEFMKGYGFDDYDFVNRLGLAGLSRKLIASQRYLSAISHSKEERSENMPVHINFQSLFVRHILPFKSELLFLFKDNTFSLGIVVNNYTRQLMRIKYLIKRRSIRYSDKLTKDDWIRGCWSDGDGYLQLFLNDGRLLKTFQFSDDKRILSTSGLKKYFAVENNSTLITQLLLFHSVISNRNRMEFNLRQKKVKLNDGKFGVGTVYRNFETSTPISL